MQIYNICGENNNIRRVIYLNCRLKSGSWGANNLRSCRTMIEMVTKIEIKPIIPFFNVTYSPKIVFCMVKVPNNSIFKRGLSQMLTY